MLASIPEIFSTIESTSIFLILLISIIIITSILYHNRKRSHKIDLANFQNTLLQAQLETREQTMQTIGADLHDNIGQLLSLVSQTLGSIDIDDAGKAQQKIDSALDFTKQSIKEMRLLGKLLQGGQLIGMGLCEAIRHMINWIEKSGQYIVNYDIEGEQPAQNNPDKDLILFRILQEVFNNIIKHSKATEISIKLTYGQSEIRLQVFDNGMGFDIGNLPDDQKGMGLMNIQKRAEIVGGRFFIQSQQCEGTCIEIFIPYP